MSQGARGVPIVVRLQRRYGFNHHPTPDLTNMSATLGFYALSNHVFIRKKLKTLEVVDKLETPQY